VNKAFTSYDDYFEDSVDEDALTYLALANKIIHSLKPDAISIAEDVSGMPGLASQPENGGVGFDYRFALGIPDFWIKLIKEVPDENWNLGHLWFELTNRRTEEKTISYTECHDQALVGDKSIIFRLIGADMYEHMRIDDENIRVARGVALHKMIRLITLATAGAGYLNFMGNEFGHPEWIDFPREGNNWSYKYSRRQWHLVDDNHLKYQLLDRFDRDMIELTNRFDLLEHAELILRCEHIEDKVISFERAGLLFVFNFHPFISHVNYSFEVLPGTYQMILDSDASVYGGHQRLFPDQIHHTFLEKKENQAKQSISLYLPTRTGLVLNRGELPCAKVQKVSEHS
jgi:1,4-alpha-glucan branching enzyme